MTTTGRTTVLAFWRARVDPVESITERLSRTLVSLGALIDSSTWREGRRGPLIDPRSVEDLGAALERGAYHDDEGVRVDTGGYRLKLTADGANAAADLTVTAGASNDGAVAPTNRLSLRLTPAAGRDWSAPELDGLVEIVAGNWEPGVVTVRDKEAARAIGPQDGWATPIGQRTWIAAERALLPSDTTVRIEKVAAGILLSAASDDLDEVKGVLASHDLDRW